MTRGPGVVRLRSISVKFSVYRVEKSSIGVMDDGRDKNSHNCTQITIRHRRNQMAVSGIETGGSGGSMNRGPPSCWAPQVVGPHKFFHTL